MIKYPSMKTPKLVFFAALCLIAGTGCSHAPSKHARGSEKRGEATSDSGLERLAETAVDQTEKDERMAPKIQREMNAIFFKGKDEKPGGFDAFSPDRMQALEVALAESDRPAILYYRENRGFFDRMEDSGGGFRIVANAKRLVPYRWTKAGRRKLFQMDTARVEEMIAHPCFTAVEDCGENSSDGEANTTLLDEWTKKYPAKEFRDEENRVLRKYLTVLKKYQKRVGHGVSLTAKPRKGKPESARVKRRRGAARLVGTHIRGVEILIKE
jgi:hypothetical protein